MSLQSLMDTVLPQTDGNSAHMTSEFCKVRNGVPHGGIDFNYVGGQNGINLEYPPVYSPVWGTVEFVGGKDGTVAIRDYNGILHQVMHLASFDVAVIQGETVGVGQQIGTMGKTGPGISDYHVHYQIKDSHGHLVDPEAFWANQDPTPGATPNVTGMVLPGGKQDCLAPKDLLDHLNTRRRASAEA